MLHAFEQPTRLNSVVQTPKKAGNKQLYRWNSTYHVTELQKSLIFACLKNTF